MIGDADLFAWGEHASIRGMVRTTDPAPSVEAAQRVKECRSKLHAAIVSKFQEHGPMTDEELDSAVRTISEFAHYDVSTIRKRRVELYQAGRVAMVADRTNSRGFTMTVWGLTQAPQEPPPL